MIPIAEQYRVFARFYDRWMPEPDADLAFWARRAREAGGPVVELGVGTGRVAVPLAREGIEVIGVDASSEMLAVARRKAIEAGVAERVQLLEADFRSFVADPPVGLVFIAINAFMHLGSTEDQLATLRAIHASLRPGGRCILSLFVPDPEYIVTHDGRRFLQSTSVDGEGASVEIWATPRYEIATQTIREQVEAVVQRAGAASETYTWAFTLRMVYRYEMEHLLARTGFDVEALWGDYDEAPLTEEKRRMIWVARKP